MVSGQTSSSRYATLNASSRKDSKVNLSQAFQKRNMIESVSKFSDLSMNSSVIIGQASLQERQKSLENPDSSEVNYSQEQDFIRPMIGKKFMKQQKLNTIYSNVKSGMS